MKMVRKSFRVYHGKKLMPWATGVAVWNAAGYVWLSGAEGRDPHDDHVVPGTYNQAKMCMQKIKDRLEEFGTSLKNIVSMHYYIAGPEFPNGVANDQKWIDAKQAVDDFFVENGVPEYSTANGAPPGTLLGVVALALKEMIVEIRAVAALPE